MPLDAHIITPVPYRWLRLSCAEPLQLPSDTVPVAETPCFCLPHPVRACCHCSSSTACHTPCVLVAAAPVPLHATSQVCFLWPPAGCSPTIWRQPAPDKELVLLASLHTQHSACYCHLYIYVYNGFTYVAEN